MSCYVRGRPTRKWSASNINTAKPEETCLSLTPLSLQMGKWSPALMGWFAQRFMCNYWQNKVPAGVAAVEACTYSLTLPLSTCCPGIFACHLPPWQSPSFQWQWFVSPQFSISNLLLEEPAYLRWIVWVQPASLSSAGCVGGDDGILAIWRQPRVGFYWSAPLIGSYINLWLILKNGQMR